MCCCNPELPYEEVDKFEISKQNPELPGFPIFTSDLKGTPIVNVHFDNSRIPWISTKVIGRDIELQKLVEFISLSEKGIIIVKGSNKSEIESLIKTAAKYVMMRIDISKYKPVDGFDILSLSDDKYVCTELVKMCLSPHHFIQKDSPIPNLLLGLRKLIFIDYKGLKHRLPHLIEELERMINKNVKIKFIVRSDEEINDVNVDEIELRDEIAPKYGYRILKANWPELTITSKEYNDLIIDIQNYGMIIWLGYQLRHNTLSEVCEKFKEINKDKIQYNSYKEVATDLKKMVREKCNTLFPLKLFSIMPCTIFESTFEIILKYSNLHIKEDYDNCIEESNNMLMITKEKATDSDCYFYNIHKNLKGSPFQCEEASETTTS